MALTVPKLAWPTATEASSFIFKFPPRRQSASIQKGTRHDNTSSYGIRESIYERTETFLNIEMDNVLVGTDIANWQSFLAYALQGGQFYYFPDSTNPDPPSSPSLTSVAGGTLAAATYYVKTTYVTPNGETVVSVEAGLAVAANNLLKVNSPASAGNATGWNVYVATSSGNETLQNASPIALGTAWTEPTTGLISGASPPSSSATRIACTLHETDFDAAWKTVGQYDFRLTFRQVIT